MRASGRRRAGRAAPAQADGQQAAARRFIQLPRVLFEDPWWQPLREPLCRVGAFAWLVSRARFQAGTTTVDGREIALQRGQLSHSVRFLAKAWSWDASRVQRFLSALAERHMIATSTDTGQTIITICNYGVSSLQGRTGDTDADTGATQDRHSLDTESLEGEKEEGEKGKDSSAALRRERLERTQGDLLSAKVVSISAGPEEARDAWNEVAARCELHQVRFLTDERKQRLRKLLARYGMDGFRGVLREIEANAFLLGEGRTSGPITFDQVLDNKLFVQLLESSTAPRRSPASARSRSDRPSGADTLAAFRAARGSGQGGAGGVPPACDLDGVAEAVG